MNRAVKWVGGLVAALGLMGLLAWLNQEAILLTLVEIAADRRTPVGPNRPVAWASSAAANQERARSDWTWPTG